jgi:hypothetical protein
MRDRTPIPVRDASERHDGTFSRGDFRWDKRRGVYVGPNNKTLHTTGTVHDGNATPLSGFEVRLRCLLAQDAVLSQHSGTANSS